jgi:hypothetical protein
MLVSVLWIFFRAEHVRNAWDYIVRMCTFKSGSNYAGVSREELLFSALVIGIMLWRENQIPGHFIRNNRLFYAYIGAMTVICYYFGVFIENQFIYFQF